MIPSGGETATETAASKPSRIADSWTRIPVVLMPENAPEFPHQNQATGMTGMTFLLLFYSAIVIPLQVHLPWCINLERFRSRCPFLLLIGSLSSKLLTCFLLTAALQDVILVERRRMFQLSNSLHWRLRWHILFGTCMGVAVLASTQRLGREVAMISIYSKPLDLIWRNIPEWKTPTKKEICPAFLLTVSGWKGKSCPHLPAAFACWQHNVEWHCPKKIHSSIL